MEEEYLGEEIFGFGLLGGFYIYNIVIFYDYFM